MDYRYLLIGIIFIVLITVFGNSPFKAPLTPQERFNRQLEQSLESDKSALGNFMGGQNDPGYFPGGGQPGNTAPTGPVRGVTQLPESSPTQQPTALPAYPTLNKGFTGYAQPTAIPRLQEPQQRYLTPPSNIYQQPPLSWAEAQQKMKPVPSAAQQLPGQDTVPAFYLKDGRRVFFSGYSVQYIAADGSLKSLPDGRYALQSGDIITIRGGQRVAR